MDTEEAAECPPPGSLNASQERLVTDAPQSSDINQLNSQAVPATPDACTSSKNDTYEIIANQVENGELTPIPKCETSREDVASPPDVEPEMEDFEKEVLSLVHQIWEETNPQFRRKGQPSEKKVKKCIKYLGEIHRHLLSPKNLEGYKVYERFIFPPMHDQRIYWFISLFQAAIVEIMEINNEEEVSSARQKADYEDEMSQKLSRSVTIFKNLDQEFEKAQKAIAKNESLKKQHRNLETLVTFLESKEAQLEESASKFKELIHDISTLSVSDSDSQPAATSQS